MKTAISIPENLFAQADRFARHRKMTRSALFAIAVDEFMQQHRDENVTERLNEVYANESSSLSPLLHTLQAQSIPKEDWS